MRTYFLNFVLKSTSTKEYGIKYFFKAFFTSLMTSFYKETYELLVMNTNKELCYVTTKGTERATSGESNVSHACLSVKIKYHI